MRFIKYSVYSILILLLLLVLVAIIIFFTWNKLPYQPLIEHQLTRYLRTKALQVNSLNLLHLNTHETTLTDIHLGQEPGLQIHNLTADYTPSSLLAGHINTLTITGINATLTNQPTFSLFGLEPLFTPASEPQTPNTFTVPLQIEALPSFIPDHLTIDHSTLTARFNDKTLGLPFSFIWNKHHAPQILLTGQPFHITGLPYRISGDTLTLNGDLVPGQYWQGTFSIPSLTILDTSPALPPLMLTGNWHLTTDTLTSTLLLQDQKKMVDVAMKLSLPLFSPKTGLLTVSKLHFPWGGGTISTRAVVIPLALDKPITLNAVLHDVDLANTLEPFSDGKIKGTGKISGSFPMIYYPDGRLILKDGTAERTSIGTISVSPDLLPGNNAQLELARTTLQNFHYTNLKIMVSSQGDKSQLHLRLEGKNPDTSEPRPVVFNINLTGDLLPFIKQSLASLTNVQSLLKQMDK